MKPPLYSLRARGENPAAANHVDRALIQSLEEQLNNVHQQLNQLHVGHAPSAAEGQMSVQQSETNEQLEALQSVFRRQSPTMTAPAKLTCNCGCSH